MVAVVVFFVVDSGGVAFFCFSRCVSWLQMPCCVAFFCFLCFVLRDTTTTVALVALRWRFCGAFGLSQVVAMFAVVVSVALVALFCQELCGG